MYSEDGSKYPVETKSKCINCPGPKVAPLDGAVTISIEVHSGSAANDGRYAISRGRTRSIYII